MDTAYAQLVGPPQGLSVQEQHGCPFLVAGNFYVRPTDSVRPTRPKNLEKGFLDREPRGVMTVRIPPRLAIVALPGGVHTLQETRTVSLHSLANPGDFNQINPDPDDHGEITA